MVEKQYGPYVGNECFESTQYDPEKHTNFSGLTNDFMGKLGEFWNNGIHDVEELLNKMLGVIEQEGKDGESVKECIRIIKHCKKFLTKPVTVNDLADVACSEEAMLGTESIKVTFEQADRGDRNQGMFNDENSNGR